MNSIFYLFDLMLQPKCSNWSIKRNFWCQQRATSKRSHTRARMNYRKIILQCIELLSGSFAPVKMISLIGLVAFFLPGKNQAFAPSTSTTCASFNPVLDLSNILLEDNKLATEFSFLQSFEEELLNSPIYVDRWGFKINWTNPEDGWRPSKRLKFLANMRLVHDQHKYVMRFTKKGYKIIEMPKYLHQLILDNRDFDKMEPEVFEKDGDVYINAFKFANDSLVYANRTFMIPLVNEDLVSQHIKGFLIPTLESWSKKSLDTDEIIGYGTRRYTRGASLALHVDQLPTHIISAILQVDQKVDKEWPLTIIDHQGKKKKLFLKPGQVVLYESASMLHGRQFPLEGDYYDNIFIHFKPRNKQILSSNMDINALGKIQ